MLSLFTKTRVLEKQLEDFLDAVEQGALTFHSGVRCYFSGGAERLDICMQELCAQESRADDLRRAIESSLYRETLIPESRGDVLGLIESTDHVLNLMEATLQQFSVEIPDICPDLQSYYLDLAEISSQAVLSMTKAVRAYFSDLEAVRDHINKVIFYEKEADRLADMIKRRIFRKEKIKLCSKIHMRYFAYHIEHISDVAEDVCDRLAIATIKRYV
jgi:predicted phosphate transport protein (TIGR00153 family)